ncbi:hypothetical protein E4T43_00432 [Aureobasidium subglaciale]|nr:hypothetical protein E4T43_00432 [Aureobasidium subglaciale]
MSSGRSPSITDRVQAVLNFDVCSCCISRPSALAITSSEPPNIHLSTSNTPFNLNNTKKLNLDKPQTPHQQKKRTMTDTTPYPLTNPPTDLSAISQIDSSILFPSFTTTDAWILGNLLRSRLSTYPSASVISITLANTTPLFYTAVSPGVTPDNTFWVARKSATVLRFGCSTWYMHNKFQGDEKAFAEKYCLQERAKEYAIHGGGFPVRVKGVEGVVAVIVVSGLKQQQDHQVIVQTCRDFLDGVGEGEEKRKED